MKERVMFIWNSPSKDSGAPGRASALSLRWSPGLFLSFSLLSFSVACDGGFFADCDGGGCAVDGGGGEGGGGAGGGGAGGARRSWEAQLGPCVGSKLSALACEGAARCFVGCGANGSGEGLYETRDGGRSWSQLRAQSQPGLLEGFRVFDLDWDQAGDRLSVSGVSTTSSLRAIVISPESGAVLETLYQNISTRAYSMTVGNFAEDASGLQLVESLTGTGLLVRRSRDQAFLERYRETEGWASAEGWWSQTAVPESVQVLSLTTAAGRFVASGAQINTPPVVYLPPRAWSFASSSEASAELNQLFETVALATGPSAYQGECWQIAGDEEGLAVVCVDQGADQGRIYTIGADWPEAAYEPANWTLTRNEELPGGASRSASWNEGVCRGPGGRVTVVGRDSRRDRGYVLQSGDNGQRWRDLTGDLERVYGGGFGPVTRCAYAGGALIVGGADLYATIAADAL